MKDVIKELKTEFNAYAETLLAHRISEQTAQLHSVHKVSHAILTIIVANQEILTETLDNSPHVRTELLSPQIHGHLTLPNHKTATGRNVLDLMMKILQEERNDLANIMQIHTFFIHRLYDKCANKDEAKKDVLVKQIFYNDLFAKRKRYKFDNRKENLVPGIVINSTLAHQLLTMGIHKPTSSPKDLHVLSDESDFYKEAKNHRNTYRNLIFMKSIFSPLTFHFNSEEINDER